MSLTDFFGPEIQTALGIMLRSAIVWVPIILFVVGWDLWLKYKREQFVENIDWKLLEIRIPKEVLKSPLAMELVLIKAIHQTGGIDTWYKRYVLGSVLFWFSLEIVSIEGRIHFLIRTPSRFQSLLESQIYAQFPQAEISEVEDYTYKVPTYYDGSGWSMWGTDYALSKPDPYPIKTYVDFGLDKNATSLESEQQIDPITSTLEYMGSLKSDEQMWIQILVRALHGVPAKRYHSEGHWFKKRELKDVAKEEIQKIIKEPLYAAKKDKDGNEPPVTSMRLSKGQQNIMEAIERNMEKVQFDCGIRGIYIAKKDSFDAGHITGINAIFKQYGSPQLNSFKITNFPSFDYPWQDYSGKRSEKLKQEIFDAYRLRSYFYTPHHSRFIANKRVYRKPFVLSSEELATIYHFPGKVSETPSFKRIESKKAEPPVDLPI